MGKPMTEMTEISPRLKPENTDQALVLAMELRKEKSIESRRARRYTLDDSRSSSNSNLDRLPSVLVLEGESSISDAAGCCSRS